MFCIVDVQDTTFVTLGGRSNNNYAINDYETERLEHFDPVFIMQSTVTFDGVEYKYTKTIEGNQPDTLEYVFESSESSSVIGISLYENSQFKFVAVYISPRVTGEHNLSICGPENYKNMCVEENPFDGVFEPGEIRNAVDLRGVSSKEKPEGVPLYSIYLELDTGKFYYYTGSSWEIIPKGE